MGVPILKPVNIKQPKSLPSNLLQPVQPFLQPPTLQLPSIPLPSPQPTPIPQPVTEYVSYPSPPVVYQPPTPPRFDYQRNGYNLNHQAQLQTETALILVAGLVGVGLLYMLMKK